MRVISMVSTKDHFIYIVSCEYAGEELWSETTGEIIGFVATGQIKTFLKDSNAEWVPHKKPESFGTNILTNLVGGENPSDITSPGIHSRANNVPYGAVCSSSDTLHISIVPKENAITGIWGNFTPLLASPEELAKITENTNTAFNITEQCTVTQYRSIDNFSDDLANTSLVASDGISII